jgi:hypothetical protein
MAPSLSCRQDRGLLLAGLSELANKYKNKLIDFRYEVHDPPRAWTLQRDADGSAHSDCMLDEPSQCV